MSTTTPTPVDPLIRAFEGSSHIWVMVLLGAVAVALGVIVLVTGWHHLPNRNGRHRPQRPEVT